ncbi:MAG: DUF4365 domain-containing protein [Snowella sp.]|nr:DUF4365 domain-containing protein [Snowella sp.]
MITKTDVPWYVTKRGELLTKQLLFELAPDDLFYTGDHPEHLFDYMVLFLKPDGSPVTIAITVKATEEEINGVYPVKVSELNKLKNSNIPVLILVIDVKRNHYFFNWVKNISQLDESESLKSDQSIEAPLRHGTSEEIQKLKQEIMTIT